jgi:hypothetical protein
MIERLICIQIGYLGTFWIKRLFHPKKKLFLWTN